MGCTSSAPQDIDPQAKAQSKQVESKLHDEKHAEQHVIKVLLLGAGESGKSTIFKQMKILHKNGFTPEERLYYRGLILQNTVESLQSIILACKTLQVPIEQHNHGAATRIERVKIYEEIPLECKQDIQTLWQDAGVQVVYGRASEFHLIDSAGYFLDAVDRVFQEAYLPSDQDILRSRIATTGIVQTDFWLESLHFKLFDVGGQRGERKKWLHCFDAVTAILFIASLSEYDQVLAENRTRNRLKESLFLFEGIINLPWFRDTPIILFLNKNDIFEEKVKRVNIADYFPAYKEGLNYDAGLAFIQEQYFNRNNNPQKTIFCHITDATNTQNIAFVWKCTKHIILEQQLSGVALM